MNYLDALNWRYAVKSFSLQKISEEQVNGLIESVRLSPSAYGLQPYQLIVVENEQVKEACLPFSYGQNKVAKCSHLFIFANKTRITAQDIAHYINELAHAAHKQVSDLADYQATISGDILSKTPSQQAIWSEQQCFLALGHLLSYAALNGIDSCPMTGFDNQGINQALGLDALGLNAAILCPVGIRHQNDTSANRIKYRKNTQQLLVSL